MKKLFILLILFILIIVLHGIFIDTNGYKIIEKDITINDISSSFNGFKIIQFSDLLIGSSKNTDDLKKIVNSINELKPDIVVFTGDLISKNYNISENEIKVIKQQLLNINPSINKYAVVGDNDQSNLDLYEDILKSSEFKLLNDESTYIFYKDIKPIKLTGITNINNIDKALLIDDNLETYYNIVITHYPDNFDILKEKDINLVLAGHSLKGQIIIPIYGGILKNHNKYIEGYYNENNKIMYISGGLGTEKIKFRLFNKPEINLYRLKKEQ